MRRRIIETAALAAFVAALMAGASCGSTTQPAAPTRQPVESRTTMTAPDPYERWLEMAAGIPDAPELTRDDAQLRAMLGCGQAWAPGTVDAALQEAYAGLIDQWRGQGAC